MKISEVYPDYVFSTIATGKKVDAIDFKKRTYVDLSGQTIGAVQLMLARARADKDIKFFQLEEETPE